MLRARALVRYRQRGTYTDEQHREYGVRSVSAYLRPNDSQRVQAPIHDLEDPSTQYYYRSLVSKAIPLMVFGTRVLIIGSLDPLGLRYIHEEGAWKACL